MTNKTGPIGPYKLMIKHILFVDIFTSYLQVNRLCMSTKSNSHTIHNTTIHTHILFTSDLCIILDSSKRHTWTHSCYY